VVLLPVYHCSTRYKSTAEHGNTDGLSTLPPSHTDGAENIDKKIASLFNIPQIKGFLVTSKEIANKTARDPVLYV
jgi:hypothetical protein